MGQFSMVHILILLVIVLVFFGPSRLPQMGSSLGKAIRDFKKGLDGTLEEDEQEKARLAKREANKELGSSGTERSETRSESKKENS